MGIFNEFFKKEKPVFTGLRFGFGSGGGASGPTSPGAPFTGRLVVVAGGGGGGPAPVAPSARRSASTCACSAVSCSCIGGVAAPSSSARGRSI